MRHLALFVTTLLLVLAPQAGYSTITVSSYSNASEIDQSGSVPIVYAGTAGSDAGCAGTGLCNNCTGGLTACNRKRVTGTTEFSISFTSDSKYGKAYMADDDDGSTFGNGGTTSTATGQTVGLTYAWSDICNEIDSTHSDCETVNAGADDMNDAEVFRVGVDANNDGKLDSNDDYIRISFKVQRSMANTVSTATGDQDDASNGIYDFTIYPGDEKVYLEDPSAWPGFPSSAQSIQYTKTHLLYLPVVNQDCTLANGLMNNTFVEDTSKSSIQNIKSDGNLSDDRFYNLTNDQWYVFKVALEDQAHNVGLFTPDADCVNAKHVVRPGEVLGLLKETQNCFIATAAFGSPLSRYVQTFRDFRDQILLPTKFGKEFVRYYYNWGKPAAQVIKENSFLKKAAQIALYPAAGVASLALLIGPWPTLVILLSLLGCAVILLSWAWNKRRANS